VRDIWCVGRAIAQEVSRWLLTAAAQVRARSGHVGFVVEKVAFVFKISLLQAVEAPRVARGRGSHITC
jgi:hypothetical protein